MSVLHSTTYDHDGNKRSPEEDNPEFYTLGAGGMVDAMLENMENFSWKDGSKDPVNSDEKVSGKMMFPNSGLGSPMWHGDIFLPYMPMPDWMKPDPMMPTRKPDKFKLPAYKQVPRPTPGQDLPDDWKPGNNHNIDPGFDPHWIPEIPSTLPEWGAGYNNPSYGLPSGGGGSFMESTSEGGCNIPDDMQPGIPSGGLFGSDLPMPGWDDPGYKPPSDFTFPVNGPEIMPEPYPGETDPGLPEMDLSHYGRPSIDIGSIGKECTGTDCR